MTSTQRSFLYPVLVIGIGILMFLLAVDVLPPAIGDLMERSWAALLVILGLNLILEHRVRFGSWLALGITAIGLGAIIYYGYSTQINTERTDYTQTLAPLVLGDHIQAIHVQVDTLNTTVKIQYAPDLSRTVAAEFIGSSENEVTIDLRENETGIVELVIEERLLNSIPDLDKMGRGRLVVTLPVGIPIESLVFNNQSGGATLDLQGLEIPEFTVHTVSGDMEVYLPVQGGIRKGDIAIENGNLQVVVRPELMLYASNVAANTEVNPNVYVPRSDGVIESRGANPNAGYDVVLGLNVPEGTLTIKAPEELSQ